jgi:hypothetical protein
MWTSRTQLLGTIQSPNLRRLFAAVAVLAVLQFILQLSLLARGVEYVAAALTIDDTYYYLQTAWNTKLLGFVTFDGLHPTNGVQFLWFLVILVLTFIAQTKTALLLLTLAVSFVFNGLCYVFIALLGATVQRPALALLLAAFWLLQSLPFRVFSMGMENSLHALVFWCALWQSLAFLVRTQNGTRPNYWGLTISLILNAWTRLDSALLSVLLYAFCTASLASTYWPNLRLFLQKHGRVMAGTSLLAAAGLLVQLAAFWLMGHSILPVSALVKTSGQARGLSSAALDKFVEVLVLGLPSVLQTRFSTPPLILLAALGLLLALPTVRFIARSSSELRALGKLWVCLLAGELIYHAYVAVSGVSYMPYFIWYRSPSFIFWNLTGALGAFYAIESATLMWPRLAGLRWAPMAASLSVVLLAVYWFVRSLGFTSELYSARYGSAQWIEANSQPGTIYAAWNTGQLSYYSNRTFINLDGVINSLDYYEQVLSGSMPLMDYLHQNNVAYIVDYAQYASLPDLPVVQAFPINDGSGRSLRVWQLSPQAAATP